ncbi:MAG TPA: hypothetical protein VMU89_04235 [Thermomicrobiaceae bacterium]|nr:hypothetical protein [Thermomicrobiaceae bacterium]
MPLRHVLTAVALTVVWLGERFTGIPRATAHRTPFVTVVAA